MAHETADEAAIRDASRRLRETVGKGGRAAIERGIAGDLIFIDAAGKLGGGEEAIAALGAIPLAPGAKNVVRNYGTLGQITWRSPVAGGEHVAVEVWVDDGQGWRARIVHLNTIADPASEKSHPPLTPLAPGAAFPACRNPLEFVPCEPKSDDEKGIISSFQALEKAVVHNEPEEWVKYVADEFIVYRTNQHPTTKGGRATALGRQRDVNAETYVAEAESMQLWVFDNAAIMRADHVMPGNRRPPYRATRLWVKRDGRWLMALSQQTTRAA